RPDGARESDRTVARSPAGGPQSRRRRLAIAGAVAAAFGIAAAVALLLTLGLGSRSSHGPASSTSQLRQEPPWGFTGSWRDYCYQPLFGPPEYAVHVVSTDQPCRSGSTRFS